MKPKLSITLLLGLLLAVMLFHVAVISKVVPYDIAWGGRLQNDSEMYVFETVSILVNLFLGLILLMKGKYIRFRFKKKTIDLILWFFLVLFALNTVGNLFAKTTVEKSFAVLTFAFVVLIGIVLRTEYAENMKEG